MKRYLYLFLFCELNNKIEFLVLSLYKQSIMKMPFVIKLWQGFFYLSLEKDI